MNNRTKRIGSHIKRWSIERAGDGFNVFAGDTFVKRFGYDIMPAPVDRTMHEAEIIGRINTRNQRRVHEAAETWLLAQVTDRRLA